MNALKIYYIFFLIFYLRFRKKSTRNGRVFKIIWVEMEGIRKKRRKIKLIRS